MTEKSCCQSQSIGKKQGIWSGLLYGLIPHTFCIAFIVLSVIGATTATVFLKKLLILPYFFQILIGLSVFFATLSAVFYLKRSGFLSWTGMKKKWRYLATLYGVTLLVNLLFFMVVFPQTANFDLGQNRAAVLSQKNTVSLIVLTVDIPCPGHAVLINGEIKKSPGIQRVFFRMPNLFEVDYDSSRVSLDQILDLEIFKSFKVISYEER
jgi:hypothetical protein